METELSCALALRLLSLSGQPNRHERRPSTDQVRPVENACFESKADIKISSYYFHFNPEMDGHESPINVRFRMISTNIRALGEWLFRLPKRADGPLNQEHRNPWPAFLHSR